MILGRIGKVLHYRIKPNGLYKIVRHYKEEFLTNDVFLSLQYFGYEFRTIDEIENKIFQVSNQEEYFHLLIYPKGETDTSQLKLFYEQLCLSPDNKHKRHKKDRKLYQDFVQTVDQNASLRLL